MVNQALSDLRSGSKNRQRRAVAWLMGTESRVMSFRLCCEFLERTPNSYRRSLLRNVR